jgi:DNA-binding NtrC family response regulator
MGSNGKVTVAGREITGDVREIPSHVPIPALNVLVVDDEPLIRWAITETLVNAGHHVDEAGDAASALRTVAAAGHGFDVVLLDLRLPDCRNLDLLRTLRRLIPESAVILMTTVGSPEIAAGALDLGAARVMTKPFEMADLERSVLAANRTRC